MVFNNKRGWYDILLLVVILLFAFGAITMFIGNVFSSITDEVLEDNSLSNTSRAVIENTNNRYPAIMDGGFALVLVLLYAFCMFVAYNSAQSPFLKVLAIVIMVLLVLSAILLGSVYDELKESDDSLLSTFNDYLFINFTLSNFAIVALVFIGSMIAMMGYSSNV